jgi:hypothetical protein
MSFTREQRAANAAAGLCTRCSTKGCSQTSPRPARPGRSSCAECAAYHLVKETRRRGKLKRQKRCACGDPRRLGKRTCIECAKVVALKGAEKRAALIARGICVKCCTRPTRDRASRKGPKQKRYHENAGARAAAYDRSKTTECEECSRKRRTQLANRAPKDTPTLLDLVRTRPAHKARRCITRVRVRQAV